VIVPETDGSSSDNVSVVSAEKPARAVSSGDTTAAKKKSSAE